MQTKEDKDNFKRIMFENCDAEAQINNLKDVDQKENLAKYLSQKVAFEAVSISLSRFLNLHINRTKSTRLKITIMHPLCFPTFVAVFTLSNYQNIKTVPERFWSDDPDVQEKVMCGFEVLEK